MSIGDDVLKKKYHLSVINEERNRDIKMQFKNYKGHK